MIGVLFLLLAIFFYAVISVLKFRYEQSVFTKWPKLFGPDSWENKYKKFQRVNYLVAAPDNWYYRLLNLKYRERFPGSASVFVWLTDGFHFVQMLFTFSVAITLGTWEWNAESLKELIWIVIVIKLLWTLIHEFCFSFLFIKKVKGK